MLVLIFVAILLLLLIVGAFRRRFQEATLHWGRVIAGQGQIERDIQEAKEAGDTGRAAELLGRSVHHRGLQDAITPPYLTHLTMTYWAACVGMYVWGFFVLPWYVAAPWPILFGATQRMVKSWLPAPGSDYCRRQIIQGLLLRQNRLKRKGDIAREQAADYMLTLLGREDSED
jgi:hypothetical protein